MILYSLFIHSLLFIFAENCVNKHGVTELCSNCGCWHMVPSFHTLWSQSPFPNPKLSYSKRVIVSGEQHRYSTRLQPHLPPTTVGSRPLRTQSIYYKHGYGEIYLDLFLYLKSISFVVGHRRAKCENECPIWTLMKTNTEGHNCAQWLWALNSLTCNWQWAKFATHELKVN